MNLASICLTLAICGGNPQSLITEDRVDLVEVNHHYDAQGRLLFDQVIFYDWSDVQRRFNVRGWRLVKSQAQLPVRQADGSYRSVWHDERELRRVRAKTRRETWPQYDPELAERQHLARDKLPNLTKNVVPIIRR